MKKLVACLLGFLLTAGCALPVLADGAAPTDTFTHWELPQGEKAVVIRPVYEAAASVTARSLGLQEDTGRMVDIDCDGSGNIYALTEDGCILKINPQLKLERVYKIAGEAGEPVDIAGAKGLYIHSVSEWYIADTSGGRVLRCEDGVVKQEIHLPETSLIPSDFVFQPVKVAKDSQNYLYVLSDGSYYGAVMYDPNGEFVGFYGANTVKGTILSTLANLWDRLTQNDIKRAKKVKTLPYQFADICIDSRDFAYTCTGKNSAGNTGQIRMFSPGGSNILSGADSRNFGEPDRVTRRKAVLQQNFVSIQADSDGYIYALDATYGLLYIYDGQGTLIAGFGGGRGQGEQLGTFVSACSLAVSGSRILVADSLNNSITVFERTAYGQLFMEAQELTLRSDYLGAEPLWRQIRECDAMNRLALVGLAKAAYMRGDYAEAMALSKEGNDAVTYSQALSKTQEAFVTAHFGWLFFAAIVLIAGLVALILVTVKRQVVLIPNVKCRVLFSGLVHPFRSFQEIKYKGMGSLPIAVVLTILFFISSVIAATLSDFRYTAFDASTYNSLFQLAQTVGLVLLWSVANWAVSTLRQGKGRLKEVYTVTAYSILPLILYNLIATPLSHVMASESGALLSGLYTIAVILTGIMLCVGLMTIHDFSFPQVVVTAVVTVLLMILIVFMLFMIGVLLSECWSIFSGIFLEALRL